MAYEVLARKWRPGTFDDVVGQTHVTQTLRNAISAGRLAHAYLFVGPRGIGKTSIARIFAKCMNCEQGPTVSPCGECDPCREIAAGTSLDVMEIDGASNNGVEQVRALRDTVMYAPSRSPYKIYIIDEVHMLSIAAFNALLKTLEEPPAHVKFLFATTEVQRVLPTVISRCQRFDLRRIPLGELVERLALIAETEAVDIEKEALLAVARGAEGGLRDAESALDQLISFCGKTITEQDVLSVFGLVSRQQLEALAAAILGGNAQSLLAQVAELDDSGRDLQRLVIELMEHFRNLLVILSVENEVTLPDVSDDQMQVLREQASGTHADRILQVIDILTEAEDRMKYALSKRSLLETALIRAGRAATVVSLDEILKHIEALRSGVSGALPPAQSGAAPNAAAPQQVESPPPVDTPPPESMAPPPADPDSDLRRLSGEWRAIIDRVAKRSVVLRGILLDARPLRVDNSHVVIGVDPEFADELESLQAGRNRIALERTLEDFLGRPVKVSGEILKGDLRDVSGDPPAQSLPPESTVEPGDEAVKKNAQTEQQTGKPGSRRNWAEEESVKKTLTLFNGRIVDIRE